VRVQVDEPRRHHQSGGIDGLPAAEPRAAHSGDAPAADADVADVIEACLGVDHPSAANHDVVGALRRHRRRNGEGQRKAECSTAAHDGSWCGPA
jgi:hypothetical protein